MSIFNVMVSPQRAVIAADTAAATYQDGDRVANAGHVSKMVPVPHLQAVFVARGPSALLLRAAGLLLGSMEDDVHELVQDFRADLWAALLHYHDHQAPLYAGGDVEAEAARDTFNAVLVAWCPERQAPVAFGFIDPAAWGRMYERGPFLGAYDQIEDMDRLKRLILGEPSLETAREVARMQFDQLREDQVRLGFGGHLTTAVLEPDGMRLGFDRGFFEGEGKE